MRVLARPAQPTQGGPLADIARTPHLDYWRLHAGTLLRCVCQPARLLQPHHVQQAVLAVLGRGGGVSGAIDLIRKVPLELPLRGDEGGGRGGWAAAVPEHAPATNPCTYRARRLQHEVCHRAALGAVGVVLSTRGAGAVMVHHRAVGVVVHKPAVREHVLRAHAHAWRGCVRGQGGARPSASLPLRPPARRHRTGVAGSW